LDFLLLDEEAERRRREYFRVRRDAEERSRVHRRRIAELAYAVALRDHYGVVLDDREGEAGHLELAHRAHDPLIDVGRRRAPGLRGGGGRERAREEQEGGRRPRRASSAVHHASPHARCYSKPS